MRKMRSKAGITAVAIAAAIGAGAVAPAFFGMPRAYADEAQTPTASATLLYKLDFSDSSNIGKNSAGNTFSDAVLLEGNTLSVVEKAHKGKNALLFPGGDHVNYLDLPADVFQNQDVVTLAGWFKTPADIIEYTGEIGIYAGTADVAFRTDPRATYHGNSYLFGIGKGDGNYGIVGDTHVKPIYEAWYHMAYVIDGTNHKFTVYENGENVYESNLSDTFSPAQYYEAGAHFYLGQSAYETNHPDYEGQMSDFRVYAGALDSASVKTEYDIDISDYMIAEYTFDEGRETVDNVRGYNLRTYNGDNAKTAPSPTYEDGVMKLGGVSGAQIYASDGYNLNFFKGINNAMTVSMDIKINNDVTDHWKRIMELCSNGRNYVTFMSYSGRGDNNMTIVYEYSWLSYEGTAATWVLDEQPFAPKNKQWINLTYVMDGDEISVYEDGVLKGHGHTNKPEFRALFNDFISSGSFTIGACNYEGDPAFINAEYDNIRIYASAARTAEDVRTARAGYPSYTLTYAANNDTTESKSVFVRKNADATLAECEFEKEGYVFTEWNTQADGSGTSYTAGASYTATADSTLYAQWDSVSKTVTFDANGGRGEMQPQIILNGATAQLAECLFSKTGHTFAGWNTASDGSGTSYTATDEITPTEDVTLYAQWTAKSYTVTFDANGGEGEMPDLDMTFGVEKSLTANAFTRHGYTFGGWALTEQGTAEYEDCSATDGIGEGNDVTLYAVWVIGSFTVTFDANGGDGEMSAQVVTAFTTATITANAFTKEGCIFDGWNTASDGSGTAYADGASIAMQDNVTLYATWKAKQPGKPDEKPDEKPGEKPGENKTDGENKPNVGAIVGGVVGGVAALAIACGLAFYFIRKKKKS